MNFDKLIRWLGQMEKQWGITVQSISLNAREAPGMVQARVTLGRAG